MESERKNYADKNYEHEKERMQWQMEKDVLTQTKHDLEEKYESISQKYNYQQRDLDQYKKPPTSKIKEATKFAIKDFLKTNTNNHNNTMTPVLQKNILNKTSNMLSLDRFNKEKDELNASMISGQNSTADDLTYDMKFTNNELSHNGSRKRLNTSINTDTSNFMKDRLSKKFSLFSNNKDVRPANHNDENNLKE